MVKILTTVFATGLLVLFGMQNSDHVPVSLIVGSPRSVRLVFLIAIAGAVGFLFSYVRGLGRTIALSHEIAELRKACKEAYLQLSERSGADDAE